MEQQPQPNCENANENELEEGIQQQAPMTNDDDASTEGILRRSIELLGQSRALRGKTIVDATASVEEHSEKVNEATIKGVTVEEEQQVRGGQKRATRSYKAFGKVWLGQGGPRNKYSYLRPHPKK